MIGARGEDQRSHRRVVLPARHHEKRRTVQIEWLFHFSQQRLGHFKVGPSLALKLDGGLAANPGNAGQPLRTRRAVRQRVGNISTTVGPIHPQSHISPRASLRGIVFGGHAHTRVEPEFQTGDPTGLERGRQAWSQKNQGEAGNANQQLFHEILTSGKTSFGSNATRAAWRCCISISVRRDML